MTAATMKQELYDYLTQLVFPTLKPDDVRYFRFEEPPDQYAREISKDEDDNRFPDFDKIRNYICASNRTEQFLDRLNRSIEELSKHLHESYSQEYQVDLSGYLSTIAGCNAKLAKAMALLSVEALIGDLSLPEIKLLYTENPREDTLPVVDDLIKCLSKLAVKIGTFIRQYNVYGVKFKGNIDVKVDIQASDPMHQLSKALEKTCEIVNKKYSLDIFSDGSDELNEMLSQLWRSIYILLNAPLFSECSTYTFADGSTVVGEDLFKTITESCSSRCPDVAQLLDEKSFLDEIPEEKLSSIYKELATSDAYFLLKQSNSDALKVGAEERQLNALIGLDSIKKSILKIKAYALANKDTSDLNLHMCFYGNPGTGKTVVARLVADIFRENGILPTNSFLEVDRGGLVGQYVGETAQKTLNAVYRAMGGVLFVDEAYALVPSGSSGGDYGHEAIATLIKAMEDYRGKFCVILAGYENEMERMLTSNPGFISRIQFTLRFPDYSRSELKQILKYMANTKKYTMTDSVAEKMLDIADRKRSNENFANAREIRNILDQVIMCQSVRVLGTNSRELCQEDVDAYLLETESALSRSTKAQRIGFV